jgi:hypothetical protein
MNPTDPGPFCQSCAMPLANPEDHGTNADGGASDLYCRYCFQGGNFTQPDATVDGMVAKVEGIMRDMAMPAGVIEMTKTAIPRLARWRKG